MLALPEDRLPERAGIFSPNLRLDLPFTSGPFLLRFRQNMRLCGQLESSVPASVGFVWARPVLPFTSGPFLLRFRQNISVCGQLESSVPVSVGIFWACGVSWTGAAGLQDGALSDTMARNAEKAMTALARFRQAQLEEGKVKERRPFLASECTELPKAEKWRRQIIGEISKKVAQIQNAGLGEFRIRDLNDEINKLLREKGHWEVRIKELGGPDYGKVGPKMLDHEGKEVPGNRGYKYFGAAKDLPGVRELFEKEPLPPPRKTRAELMKAIDFEYYGYLDEDDGVIVPLEQEYEKKLRAELVEKWKAEREARLARGEKEEEEEEEEEINIYAVTEEEVLGLVTSGTHCHLLQAMKYGREEAWLQNIESGFTAQLARLQDGCENTREITGGFQEAAAMRVPCWPCFTQGLPSFLLRDRPSCIPGN